MAVEKNAVREGTRWDFRGEIVVVDEVTPKSVIHYDEHGIRTDVTPIETFLKVAQDLERSKYDRLVKAFGEFGSARSSGKDPVADAIAYLLERIGPPVPALAEPASHPVLDVAEALPADVCGCGSCAVEAPHASDCAVHNEPAYPAGPCDCETSPVEVELTTAEYDRVRSDFEALEDDYRSRKKARVR